jgi:hypothetical protein
VAKKISSPGPARRVETFPGGPTSPGNWHVGTLTVRLVVQPQRW